VSGINDLSIQRPIAIRRQLVAFSTAWLFKSDVQINDPRRGWVNSSKVEWQKEYQSPEDKSAQEELDKLDIDTPVGGGGAGFDPMILGYAAVVGALLLRGGKKGKKR